MAYIPRSMEKIFLHLNKEYPAILVTGPRQVGKTTMLQRFIERDGRKRKYVSLDDMNDGQLERKTYTTQNRSDF